MSQSSSNIIFNDLINIYNLNSNLNYLNIINSNSFFNIINNNYINLNTYIGSNYNNLNTYNKSVKLIGEKSLYLNSSVEKIYINNKYALTEDLFYFTNNNIDIKKYPPLTYTSYTGLGTTNFLQSNVYTFSIILNYADLSFGNGTYDIYYSTYRLQDITDLWYENRHLIMFNKTLRDGDGTRFLLNQYNANGDYIANTRYIKNDYLGEWIVIKMPVATIINGYILTQHSSRMSYAPQLWKFYGSLDGINYNELYFQNTTAGYTHVPQINYSLHTNLNVNNTTAYNYYGFTIQKVGNFVYTLQLCNLELLYVFNNTESGTKFINFPSANIGFKNEWFMYKGTSPSSETNSLIFWHLGPGVNSKWWLNGTQVYTNNEISDYRIKKDINDINNPLDKLMVIKPKEYFLCDDKDYLKKYGIIAQDVKETIPELVYNDIEYIANIYMKAIYIDDFGIYKLKTEKEINDINIDDEIKILLDNNDINNKEIIIDEISYNNRYKKRYIKVKRIIDKYTIEIYEPLELTDIEKNNLFIYGKKTNDFLKLDYKSIYTINIASVQEIYNKLLILNSNININNNRINLLKKKLNINND